MNIFPKRLKDYREMLKSSDGKWTQQYVANKIGVARVTYTAYENGNKMPPFDTINRLADLFDIKTDYLMGRTDSKTPIYDVNKLLVQQNLPRIRNMINLSVEKLAKEMKLSPQIINKWESGESIPTSKQVDELNNIFFSLSDDYKRAFKFKVPGDGVPVIKNRSSQLDDYNSMAEINQLLKKYNIDQSGFFDIEKWKNMGAEEIRELESYFEYITSKAKEKNKGHDTDE